MCDRINKYNKATNINGSHNKIYIVMNKQYQRKPGRKLLLLYTEVLERRRPMRSPRNGKIIGGRYVVKERHDGSCFRFRHTRMRSVKREITTRRRLRAANVLLTQQNKMLSHGQDGGTK